MAYGTSEKVLFYLGMEAPDDKFISYSNINLAIAQADEWVDSIRSEASTTDKENASSVYAAGLLRKIISVNQNRGFLSTGSVAGFPSSNLSIDNLFLKEALSYLKRTASYRTDSNI
jgi:hypothetical protein